MFFPIFRSRPEGPGQPDFKELEPSDQELPPHPHRGLARPLQPRPLGRQEPAHVSQGPARAGHSWVAREGLPNVS